MVPYPGFGVLLRLIRNHEWQDCDMDHCRTATFSLKGPSDVCPKAKIVSIGYASFEKTERVVCVKAANCVICR